MDEQLLVEFRDGVLRVTINRPEDGNAMSNEMVKEFTAIVSEAHKRSEILLLRGAGKDFCTGWVRSPNSPPPATEAYARRIEYDAVFQCYWAIRNSEIPVIGMIQGRAMGFGTAMVGLCDVSFASDAATFNIPEMNRAVPVMPTMVLSALFDRMNRNALLWMTLSSDFIDANRAMMYGLVSTVVPAAKLEQEVNSFCERISRMPRPALRGLKEYLRLAPAMDPHGALDYARSLHALVNTASQMKTTGSSAVPPS